MKCLPEYVLGLDQTRQLMELTDDLQARHPAAEEEVFLQSSSVVAHDLAREVRSRLHAFRLNEEPPDSLLVSGYRIDEQKIGPTPTSWQDRVKRGSTLREELTLILVGSLLGEPFAYATQQGGRLVHDVLRTRGYEFDQLGSGSLAELQWHTEDAFHPYRADYVLLLCMRNPDCVATTLASIDQVELSQKARETLFEPRFRIRSDTSPYLRIDPHFIRAKLFSMVKDMNRHD